MAIEFKENFYSFRITAASALEVVERDHLRPLGEVTRVLAEANNLFLARRYQAAIDAYHRAESLIFAQIRPSLSSIDISKFTALPRSPALFDTLLSASLEWMNLLPAQPLLTPVRPRIQLDRTLLGEVGALDMIGVHTSAAASPEEMEAVADLQLGRIYSDQDDPSAQVFFERCNSSEVLDPTIARVIGGLAERPPARTALAHVLPISPSFEGVPPIPVTVRADSIAPRPETPRPEAEVRMFGTMVGGDPRVFSWRSGDAPPLDEVKRVVYESRLRIADLDKLFEPRLVASDLAAYLPHAYYYTIPLGIAECYHALGDYGAAEGKYFEASRYAYLNVEIEAPYLFQRIAALYLDWGNTLFRNDEAPEAATKYQAIIAMDGSVPASALYTTPSLQPGAIAASAVITNLDKFIARARGEAVTVPDVNPTLAAIVIEARQELTKIANGLDYWGHWHASVPIWTFEYLQGAAVNFTQLAISAERDFMSFQESADRSGLTRQQIVHGVAQANAETGAARLQAGAAAAEAEAFRQGVVLANQRATDAAAAASQYAAGSWMTIQLQALGAQLGGGDNGDPNQLNAMADALQGIGPAGELLRRGWRLEGSGATLSAANQLAASRYTREYEVASLNRQAGQMVLAASQAQAELTAAQARVSAAEAAVAVADLRAEAAQEDLAAFDNQFFTPDVWYRLGEKMWRLYRRYLTMAIRVARLMQQAYNFENDESVRRIKIDYSTDEVKGLLGADALMADIQSFTFDLITKQVTKPQPIRQTISLAERYGFAFENQLRTTGSMEFETRIEDFDAYYPGTYAGRIEAVEVDVIGIVPPTGVSGTLTNSGISAYRTPAYAWTDREGSGLKYRVQSKETLVLSDYTARQDSLLVSSDARMMRVLQGAGLASTWRLDLPKAINDIDYGALTDVRITFYYKARFDPELQSRVLEQLASMPGVNERQRGIPLRWVYPDAFFRFQDTGEIAITLRASDFRTNERTPVITNIGLIVATDGGVSPAGITLSLATPSGTPVTVLTDASGAISSEATPGLAPLVGGSAVGTYVVSVPAAANPGLLAGGRLDLSHITNVALILGYRFTPRA